MQKTFQIFQILRAIMKVNIVLNSLNVLKVKYNFKFQTVLKYKC